MLTDPIADMLTRIRNANLALHDTVEMPGSSLKAEIARVRAGRDAVVEEIYRLQTSISRMGPKEAPTELAPCWMCI